MEYFLHSHWRKLDTELNYLRNQIEHIGQGTMGKIDVSAYIFRSVKPTVLSAAPTIVLWHDLHIMPV